MLTRFKIFLEYNGFNYSGWQKQPPPHNSIQQTIEQAIYNLTNQTAEVTAAGRTDAKVHAIAMVAHFDLNNTLNKWNTNNLMHGINFYLKNTNIAVFNVQEIDKTNTFHARFSAKEREYLYKILNRNYPNILQNNLAWWIAKPLNIAHMQTCANMLLGTNDFTSFRAANCYAKSPIKTINYINITTLDNTNININIAAPSFLYHQVRNIVGALVYVGLNKLSIEQFNTIFKQKNRSLAPKTAPAYGLYFLKASYD